MDADNVTAETADIKEDNTSSSIGFASSVLPEAQTQQSVTGSDTGVSTDCRLSSTSAVTTNHPPQSQKREEHWYVLRTTYGREKKAYEYITQHDVTAFYPTITTLRVINGKKKPVEVSRLPNIFFAYGTEEVLKSFVYDNVNLPYLRFYYKHTHIGAQIEKTPMIVPDNQIRSLQIICSSDASHDVHVYESAVEKFKAGQLVRITEGQFQGVTGVVARFKGQQRVGIVIEGIITAITAYVPTAFLEPINPE